MKVRIYNQSDNALPHYKTEGSAGVDLRADIYEDIVLLPLERTLVRTGLFMEIPKGYEGQIRPRSGLALADGITVANSPGTIDSDFRGEIKVILVNLSKSEFTITNGMRIAQMVFAKVEQVEWNEVADIYELDDTERGTGGFGSTGTH